MSGEAEELGALLESKELRQLCARVANMPDAPQDLRRLAAAILGKARAAKYPRVPKNPNRHHGETARIRAQVEISAPRISALVEWARERLA